VLFIVRASIVVWTEDVVADPDEPGPDGPEPVELEAGEFNPIEQPASAQTRRLAEARTVKDGCRMAELNSSSWDVLDRLGHTVGIEEQSADRETARLRGNIVRRSLTCVRLTPNGRRGRDTHKFADTRGVLYVCRFGVSGL
jgi:hypothetical protein